MTTWQSDNLFSGTARYYARFRPDYPDEMIRLLQTEFSLNKKSRILDLGCGTGQLALQLACHVSRVFAVDPQPDMLKEGKNTAPEKGILNIDWIPGESSQLVGLARDIGEIDLTVIARAFHWMDRNLTLKDLYQHVTKSGGGVAIITDNGPRDSITNSQWKLAIDETVRFWLGDTRLAGTKGTFSPPFKRHEEFLRESEFGRQKSVEIRTMRTWTIDQVIGYLYSTSSSSIPVLGDKKEGFEDDVRRRLLTINSNGIFDEEVITSILMGWKE